MTNPNNVGHPLFDAILPMYSEKIESVKMYIHGLKKIANTRVVYNVKRHLSAEFIAIYDYMRK
jgi:hypothetical protein